MFRIAGAFVTNLAVSVGAGAGTLTLAAAGGYLQTVVDGSFGGCLAPGTQITTIGPGNAAGITPVTTCAITAGTPIVVGNMTDGHGIIIDNTSCSQSSCMPATGRTLVENNITTGNGGAGIQVGPASAHVDVLFNTSWIDQVGVYETNKATYSDGAISLRDDTTTMTTDCTVANDIAVSGASVVGIQNASSGSNTWANNLFFGGNYPLPIPGTNNVLENPNLEAPASNYLTSDFRVLPGSRRLRPAQPHIYG